LRPGERKDFEIQREPLPQEIRYEIRYNFRVNEGGSGSDQSNAWRNPMLECKSRQQGDVTILDLSGRISVGEALAFGPGSGLILGDVIRELASKGQKRILLNLKDVKYIDSSGIGDLVRSATSLRRDGGDLKLLSPAPMVLEVLRVTRLDKIFEIKDDESLAVQSFSEPFAATG
jgi:anti-sigma B factor antagonist